MQMNRLQIRPKDDAEDIFQLLTPSELAGRLDLRPFMQRNPYVVAADASMTRAYRLFRTMGLRHMFVGPPTPMVNPALFFSSLLISAL